MKITLMPLASLKKQKIIIFLLMVSLTSCKSTADLTTVEKVDLEKYTGTWYEIARLPNSFEKNMKCVTATYSLKENGKISVMNRGYLPDPKGKWKTAKGTAWIPDKEFPGRLKVTFFWPFAGNYYIMVLDEHYQYALVGDPTREYLWVLSRQQILDSDIYTRLMDHAGLKGFDIQKVLLVEHDCE
jgi:apolipoprotein D and lipocalin family protein